MSYDWIIDVLFWVAVAFLVAVYVSWRATRLDRLHVRVETARAALDAALVRRAAATLELAASRLLDPATSLVLATAAHEARTADADAREFAESDLSRRCARPSTSQGSSTPSPPGAPATGARCWRSCRPRRRRSPTPAASTTTPCPRPASRAASR